MKLNERSQAAELEPEKYERIPWVARTVDTQDLVASGTGQQIEHDH